jgi:hypothetical protein
MTTRRRCSCRLSIQTQPLDGTQQIDVALNGTLGEAETLGYQLADLALGKGAAGLLEGTE